ncbi:MAG TPA: FtsX-like permease family protein [Chitinophagaceae bacterium]|nr:FtsX-like permease family protein [Chitinophagaceae bacterium]
MIKNYFKTAFRNLIRNRSYSVINIVGLTAGITVFILIFIIIQFHSSFDDFHSKKDRIYRVLTEYHHADAANVFYGHGVPFPMPQGLKATFSQIEEAVPVYADNNDQILITGRNGETVKKFKEERGVFLTEPSFFKIFDFPLLEGDYSSLKDPNNVLITKEIAEKYFGDWKEAIGKTMKWNNNDVLKVTGILAPIPANTDFQLKLVISYGSGFTKRFLTYNNWDGTSSSFGCYILLPPNISVASFNTQLRAYSKKVKAPEDKDSHIIQPLTAVHYDTQSGDYSNKTISHALVNALWSIAAFILLIACVNFINLSTAQAVNRAKEIGVRKVLGSNKWQLKKQFITETFLIVFIAVVIATGLSFATLSSLSSILELPLSIDLFHNPALILFLFTVTIAVTACAGFYPSIVLSRFSPITALKSKLSAKSKKGISLRRGLVIFQFIIAQALIIGTLIIVKQMNYFTNQPLGFNKEAVLNVPFPGDSIGTSKLDFLRKQLSTVKNIQGVSFSSNTPVEDDDDMWSTFKFNKAIKETEFYAITKFADDQYAPTYELPIVAGRNLEPSDTSREFLVNESLIKSLGIKNPQEALNKQISLWDGYMNGSIVGVLKDFKDRSFRRDLAPLLITTTRRQYSEAGIKLSTTNASATIAEIEKVWNQVFPDFVFEYKFLDDKIGSFYKQENQLSELYKIFAVIAIFLSCLGLYGLASFMAVQRIKEVGIRKVLGASARSIVYLFSKEFIILIAIAFVIATPIAWYYMHNWLQDYPYRINMSWWIFITGGIVSIAIALATVSFQAIRAAIANPVKSLRTE